MTALWLVRHGETDWNVEQRFQGSSDQPLNATGEAQAQSLASRLITMTFDGIYSSDLIRVQRTAELALNGDTESISFDERLRELYFGTWEGLTWQEAREQFPAEFELWAGDREQNPHGGERMSDVVSRITAFLDDIQSKHGKDDNVLIFAHGGVLGTLVCLLLGNDPTKWWQYRFLNCTLSQVIIVNRGAVLATLNDDAHFVNLEPST